MAITTIGATAMALVISSSVFTNNSAIDPKYTCEGKDLSPPLSWSNPPVGTKSFVLIVDDPDAPDPAAPKRTYVHWVLYNLPPGSNGLPENVESSQLPAGTLEGKNDWDRTGYGGPCPPVGRHRYYFKLYALDSLLPDLNNPTKAELIQAMEGHILEKAEVMGTYQKIKGG